jgi:phosphatidylserine decarboxylase
MKSSSKRTMHRPNPAIRREQTRMARRIHGGLVAFCIAVLGIKLSRLKIPSKRIRLALYRGVFRKKYPPGLNEAEAELPLVDYPTLNAVFTRGLKPQCRPIPAGTPQFLGPCDGTVQDVGRVERGRILSVKGIEYPLAALLAGSDPLAFEGGHYVTIFLSPIDCHRVFSPQDGRLEEVRHVPGYRLLVHPPCQRPEYPVYTLNERMVFRFATNWGPCALVMVAGWGVGNITLPFAPQFRPRSRRMVSQRWSTPRAVQRGDWIGTFELGSTVVLLTPPGAGAKALVSPNQKIQYGQPVITYPG